MFTAQMNHPLGRISVVGHHVDYVIYQVHSRTLLIFAALISSQHTRTLGGRVIRDSAGSILALTYLNGKLEGVCTGPSCSVHPCGQRRSTRCSIRVETVCDMRLHMTN